MSWRAGALHARSILRLRPLAEEEPATGAKADRFGMVRLASPALPHKGKGE
jgi:hypothetical protein